MQAFPQIKNFRGTFVPYIVLGLPISAGAKLVYAFLSNFCGESNNCYADTKRIAQMINCSTRSVQNYIHDLIEKALIKHIGTYKCYSKYMLLLDNSGIASRDDELEKNLKCQNTAVIELKSGCEKFSEMNENYSHSCENISLNSENFSHRKIEKNKNKKTLFNSCSVQETKGRENEPFLERKSDFLFGFEKIWKIYPRQDDYDFARDMWLKLVRSDRLPDTATLIRAIEFWRGSWDWNNEDGKYIPKLSFFLRDEKWKQSPRRPHWQRVEETAEDSTVRETSKNQFDRVCTAIETERARKVAAMETLRHPFHAFLDCFNDADALNPVQRSRCFGMWLYVNSKGKRLTPDDVSPDDAKSGVEAFLSEWVGRHQWYSEERERRCACE